MSGGGDPEETPTEIAAGELSEERAERERERAALGEELFLPDLRKTEAERVGGGALDLETGTFARSVLGPGRAQIKRQLALAGIPLNSPAAIQAMADFEAQASRGAGDVLSRRKDIEADRRLRTFQTAFGGGEDPLTALALQAQLEQERLA